MGKFRKKPVVIEARQFTGYDSIEAILKWADEAGVPEDNLYAMYNEKEEVDTIHIVTLEGEMIAKPGDWIIRGVNNEFYPCKPDIFDKTYEEVTE